MPIALTCPGCDARLSAPDSAAGKAVKCAQCAAVVPVPAANAGYEVVDAPRPVARAVAARPARDAEEPRPTRRPRAIDDDEDDRPRKRRPRDEDDDEDYRPRRRKAKGKKKGGIPVWMFAAGGGGLLLVIGVVVAVVMAGFGRKVQVPGGEMLGISAPSGFSTVGDSASGFRVYLPGEIRKNIVLNKNQLPPGVDTWHYGGTNGSIQVTARSFKPGDNSSPGTSPEELYALIKKWHGDPDKPGSENIVTQIPITLDGKPALEIRVKKKKETSLTKLDKERGSVPPNASPEMRKRIEESQQVWKRSGIALMIGPNRRDVYYITTNGRRIVVIQLETRDEFPSEDILKTIRESFKFQ